MSDGVFYTRRTARKPHVCGSGRGCVIHPGQVYREEKLAPWVRIQEDPEYPPTKLGEWQTFIHHDSFDDCNRDGMLDLFHRTTPEVLEEIRRMGRMVSREQRKVYFSNRRDGQATGYGEVVIHVRVPQEYANLDDEFPDGEMHYWVLDTRVSVRDFLPDSVGV